MFFITSKILAFVTSPAVWLLAIMMFALLSKSERRRKKVLLWSVVMFFFLSNSFIHNEVMGLWEVPGFDENSITQPYDAGIILGGTISYDHDIERIQFPRQGDRVIQALILYKKGKIKKIVFSGGAAALRKPNEKESPFVKSFLMTMGVPEEDILLEDESKNTHQNAAFTRVLLDKNFHNGRFLLITTSTHQRRAVKCFEKEGVKVTPYSVDRISGERRFDFETLFIPNAQAFFNWEFLSHEIVGMIVYKIAGYI